jgi:hypothetical protein
MPNDIPQQTPFTLNAGRPHGNGVIQFGIVRLLCKREAVAHF